eukprot:TRINITY_DN23531_c0_g1_i1.p1 TRINITY_DN23531_c0_g1~~TRINITY_DN23531_c0_g1_i1.p1  ORF type:complete len:302 (+),score=42.34 TRINITY_DN23531_c0_g1_i1:425-1330(+)
MAAANSLADVFRVRRLSDRVLCVIESDAFGEVPHMYVVLGKDKMIIIDTGCNTGDVREFVKSLPEAASLKALVVNTHVHYDHIMGNHCFCQTGGEQLLDDCLGICQGGRDQAFSKDWKRSSLAESVNAEICPFCVTRWLQEGERIYLDDATPSDVESLQILFTPGHTPDSISLYLPAENRLFTGDLIYPGSIFLFLPGSNLEEFAESLQKLKSFIADKGGDTILSCGHITPELPSSSLDELHQLLPRILSGKENGVVRRHPFSPEPVVIFSTDRFNLLCRATDIETCKASGKKGSATSTAV